jgi:perosamine synthetase
MKAKRMIAPTGVTVKMRDISAGIKQVWRGEAVQEQYKKEICSYLNVSHASFVNSGRTALTIVLKLFKELSECEEVLIPAYTCFSVPSAVARAGLKARLCDINLDTLDFDLAALEKALDEKVLCIIPSNLFGLVDKLPEINRIAKRYDAFVIDDAAQSFGASLKGAKSGTMGDVGVFSLGRGKNITAYEGGIIVTHSEEIARKLAKHPLLQDEKVSRWPRFRSFLGLMGYSFFIQPRLYWIPSRLPFLNLGLSKFDPGFKIEGFSRFQCALGILMLQKLDQLNEQRRQNARQLCQGLKDNPEVILPRPLQDSYPVYLRFPILVMRPALREKIYLELLRKGIGVSKMYPTAIHRIPGIGPYLANGDEPFPNADLVASSILTLPTHSMVTQKDLALMVEVINRCTR